MPGATTSRSYGRRVPSASVTVRACGSTPVALCAQFDALGADLVIAELLVAQVAQAGDHEVAERAGGVGRVRFDQRHRQPRSRRLSARAQLAPAKPPPITTTRPRALRQRRSENASGGERAGQVSRRVRRRGACSHCFRRPARRTTRRSPRSRRRRSPWRSRSITVAGRCSAAEGPHRRHDLAAPADRPAAARALDRGACRVAARARGRARRRLGGAGSRRNAATQIAIPSRAETAPATLHAADNAELPPRCLRRHADRGSSAASCGCACRSRRRSR